MQQKNFAPGRQHFSKALIEWSVCAKMNRHFLRQKRLQQKKRLKECSCFLKQTLRRLSLIELYECLFTNRNGDQQMTFFVGMDSVFTEIITIVSVIHKARANID